MENRNGLSAVMKMALAPMTGTATLHGNGVVLRRVRRMIVAVDVAVSMM